MADNEQIGFHKGSINTLLAEKAELIKMISNVDNIILAHNDSLRKMGIDYLEELRKAQQNTSKSQETDYEEPSREA